MTNKRCFVQFPHPGKEHDRVSGTTWNENKNPHRRKFMQFLGRYLDRNGILHGGELWAWGEWEPQSEHLRTFDNPRTLHGSPHPSHLWKPYYTLADNHYYKLHNTDPFIFGDAFLYSNCKQRTSKTDKATNLQNLGKGSVIVFGSGKNDIEGERQWMLDTVFVVRDFVDYDPHTMQMKQGGAWEPLIFEDGWKPPDAFFEVVGGPFGYTQDATPLPLSHTETKYRLYRGATPHKPIDGMYSFFPAIRAGKDHGFARPFINLQDTERFNPRFWQGTKGLTKDLNRDERKNLWKKLVECVCQEGMVLGTHASLPKRREHNESS